MRSGIVNAETATAEPTPRILRRSKFDVTGPIERDGNHVATAIRQRKSQQHPLNFRIGSLRCAPSRTDVGCVSPAGLEGYQCPAWRVLLRLVLWSVGTCSLCSLSGTLLRTLGEECSVLVAKLSYWNGDDLPVTFFELDHFVLQVHVNDSRLDRKFS